MSQLKLTIVGDPKPLRTATKQAEASLRKMSGIAQTVGKKMNSSLGAIGLGVGLAALTNGLKNATKAASEDRKSQGLLANALKNTVGATSSAIAGAEQYIKKTQLSTAVLDDELRPALTKAVRATGTLAGGQRLLDIALDISAETGSDLSSVTGTLSKAYAGNTGALKRLLPGVKLTANWMSELEVQYSNTAESAAKLDSYKRLEAIFADLQETVGEALLPALDEFSNYLASEDGQRTVKKIVDQFVLMGQVISGIIQFMIKNVDLIIMAGIQVLLVKSYFVALNIVIGLTQAGIIKATTALKVMKVALVTTGIGAALVLIGTLAGAWVEAAEAKEAYNSDSDALDENGNYAAPMGPGLGPNGETWLTQGYGSFEEYMADIKAKKEKIVNAAKDLADKIRKALDAKVEGMKKTGEKFRDAVGIAFGVFGEDEYSVFNEDVLIGKLKRMVAAAKGFAENIKKLRTQGADESFINEIVGMGPAQGNIVAQGLLSGGNLSEILGLRKSLYGTGTQVGAQQALAGNATYEININKAVISASDIIKEIRLLEKKSGRKYLVG